MFLTSICVIRLFEMYCANISHSSDNLRLLITLSKFIKGTNCFKERRVAEAFHIMLNPTALNRKEGLTIHPTWTIYPSQPV